MWWFPRKEAAPESGKGQTAQENTEISFDSEIVQGPHDKEEKDKEKAKDSEKEKGKEKDSEKRGESEKDKTKGLDGTNLEALLHRLPTCVSRDLIDQLTVNFTFLIQAICNFLVVFAENWWCSHYKLYIFFR